MAETAGPPLETDPRLEAPGLWVERIGDRKFPPRVPALFLDRDGTVNVDCGYPSRTDQIVLRDEIVPVIRAANEAGWAVVVVTNQSGIARGYFGWPEFALANGRVLDLLAAQGASVDLVVACAYHETGQGELGVADHPMRKPNPGMLIHASERLGIDLPSSIVVGDKPADMAAGQAAGLRAGWLVGDASWADRAFPVSPLNDAAQHLALVRLIESRAL